MDSSAFKRFVLLPFHQMAQDIIQIILLQHIRVLFIKGDEYRLCGGFAGGVGFIEGIQIIVGKNILKNLLGTGGEVFPAIVEVNHSGIDALIGQRIACMGVFPEDAYDIGDVVFVLPEGHQLHGNEVFAGDGANGHGIGELPVGLGTGQEPGRVGFCILEILVEPAVGQVHGIRDIIDGVFHGGGRMDQSINIVGRIPETVVDQNGCTSDQCDFGGHGLLDQLSVLFRDGLQVGVHVLSGNQIFR